MKDILTESACVTTESDRRLWCHPWGRERMGVLHSQPGALPLLPSPPSPPLSVQQQRPLWHADQPRPQGGPFFL